MVITEELAVHRVGPADIANFRLKKGDKKLHVPGISVLLGGSPEDAVAQMLRAYWDRGKYSRIHKLAESVSSATVDAIRKAGFDVIWAPTSHFHNHGRIIHVSGIVGFSDELLLPLLRSFLTKAVT